MGDFRVTFKDKAIIEGKAKTIKYNGKDITNKGREEITKYFIERVGNISIQTGTYEVSFNLGSVSGFTI